MSSGARGWRAAVRVARRTAWRAKGRSALVLLLIGLPVFVLSAGDVVWRTVQLDPSDVVARHLGTADVAVQRYRGEVAQQPQAWLATDGLATGMPRPSTLAQVRAAVPGVRGAVEERGYGYGTWHVRTRAGLQLAEVVAGSIASPLLHGTDDVVAGRAPARPGEVAVTAALAVAAGTHLGGVIEVADDTSRWRVVGLLRDGDSRQRQLAVIAPGARRLPGATDTWYLRTAAPITWAQVRRLNTEGWAVLSRAVVLDPPPLSQVDPLMRGNDRTRPLAILAATVVAGMALLEVTLLAGPAFAVAARRRERDLALVAAIGANRSQLRRMVLADGVVAGGLAGAGGVVLGLGAGVVAAELLGRRLAQYPGALDVRPLELAVIAVVGLATATLAALPPARRAGRVDVVAALAGRSAPTRARRAVPIAGLVVAAIGAAVAVSAAATNRGAYQMVAGVALVEAGLIAATPTLLGLLARAARPLPLSIRMALRDAGRNRSSVASAVAAVMAAVVGSVAIGVALTSVVADQRQSYDARLSPASAWIASDAGPVLPGRDVAPLARALARTPEATTLVVHALETCNAGCPLARLRIDGRPPELARPSDLPFFPVDDGTLVQTLLGPGPAADAAVRALTAGRIVAFTRTPHTATDRLVLHQRGRVLQLPVIVVRTEAAVPQLIAPPSLVGTLGPAHAAGVLEQAHGAALTSPQLQRIEAAAFEVDHGLSVRHDPGYHDAYSSIRTAAVVAGTLLAVAAALIATALTGVERRRDLATLAAVGAAPRLRRRMAAAQGVVVGGVGSLLGATAGFVAPVAFVVATNRERRSFGTFEPLMPLRVPWTLVLLVAVGVPVTAGLLAAAAGGGRLGSAGPGRPGHPIGRRERS